MINKLKTGIKRIIKRILITLKLDGPVVAAWRGYKEWKYYKKVKDMRVESSKKAVRTNSQQVLRLVEQVTKRINEIDLSKKKGIVYIFQHGYFTSDGKVYISGGGERYATDLSYLIDSLGYQSVLVQVGNEMDKEPWVNQYGKNYVIGVNSGIEDYCEVIGLLPKAILSIYSGFTYFGDNPQKPNILISHGITWDAPRENANRSMIKLILSGADSLVSVDTSTICYLRSTFSHDLAEENKQMYYIPNYTDVEQYKPISKSNNSNRIRITFPRRCAPERGFWLMAEVLPRILEQYSNVEFEFIGFVHEEKMKTKIEELERNYPGRVSCRMVDAQDMPSVYQNTDISLIPTLYCEGTSLSCIEAMACGNAVIATDVGGLPNLIIDEYNGLLIAPQEEALHDAIVRLIEQPELRRKISKNALEVAQCFSKEKWNCRWKAILAKHLLSNGDCKDIVA